MHCFNMPPTPCKSSTRSCTKRLYVLLVAVLSSALVSAQETDFSPFSRYGFGMSQGVLSPSLASLGGVTSVTGATMVVNADQPAAAAGMTHPTFQGSVHMQSLQLTETDQSAQARTGGPGNFGLVVKRPRARSAFQLGLTPMTSKSFDVQRASTDSDVGEFTESYEGSGGLARAYAGLARGWRGRQWVQAGSEDSVFVGMRGLDIGGQVDHWFGDAIQTSNLDINDVTYRDSRTSISSRHRATGWVFGVEAFQVLSARYDEFKQFQGSWVLRLGGTFSPERTVYTDFNRLVQSTLLINGVPGGLDTANYLAAELVGTVPALWTAGAGLQWDGPKGGRVGLFVDMHRRDWSSSNVSLSHLMDDSSVWGDAQSTSLGLTWTPNRKAGKIIRPTYQTGWIQSTLPVVLLSEDGEDAYPLEEWRVSLGMHAPMQGSRSASHLHVGMDFGQRHTELGGVHEERSIRLHLGVTLTPFVKNLWLTPRLYD